MGQRVNHRRDASGTWTSTNPTLQAGELGWESDTLRFKIGNGATNWVNLPYYNSSKVGAGILNGTITLSATLSANHLLGQTPDIVIGYIECVTANNGYAVGDRIFSTQLNVMDFSGNATSVNISFPNTAPTIIPKAGGAAVAMVVSNWKANARPVRMF